MFRPHPISVLQFGLFWLIVAVGAAALIRAFARSRGDGDAADPAKKSRLSRAGVALQALGFAAAGFGPVRFALPWSATSSIICAALVTLLGGSALAIFIASTRAMGRNWSVVARMRSDHQLVRSGPFAVVRHPIYLALFLYFLSFAIAFGHFGQLLIALPVYCAGTFIRIREEEKLLRAQFGQDHARYVREVPAFIPFVG
jgi:protein-S-isoprenylcysteine O-methyltransferase Ste14